VTRRIILERDKPFSSGNDNNALYFCGFTDNNSGDMIFGKLTSTDISSYSTDALFTADLANALKISIAFQYGSTDIEISGITKTMSPNSFGDCVLTMDNAYMLGVFSTYHDSTTSDTVGYNYYYAPVVTATQRAYEIPFSNSCDNEHYNDPHLQSYFSTSHYPPPSPSTMALNCEN
jgi:hypothetical protein